MGWRYGSVRSQWCQLRVAILPTPGGGGDVGGGGSGLDPDDPNTPGSTQEPSDPTKPQDPEKEDPDSETDQKSCTTSHTVTDCTVVGSATATAAETQSCSTSCAPPQVTCGVSGTTVTTKATATPSGKPCAPGDAPARLKMPRRGLSELSFKPGIKDLIKRKLPFKQTLGTIFNVPLKNSLDKRTLPTPADFNGDVVAFLIQEYAMTEWLVIHAPMDASASTGLAYFLAGRRWTWGVRGMYGCTSVLVSSKAGVWMSHFWEIGGFRAKRENWLQPRKQEDIDAFNSVFLGPMEDGGPFIPGLAQYIVEGAAFHGSQEPNYAIFTQREANENNAFVPGTLRYQSEIDAIQGVLRRLFPGAEGSIVDYEPREDEISQGDTSPSGKLILQYDPAERLVANPQNPCEVTQCAMIRTYLEDRMTWEQTWPANFAQMLLLPAEGGDPGKFKRQDDACPLPEPPKAENGVGRTLDAGPAPDPSVTNYITIGAGGGATETAATDTEIITETPVPAEPTDGPGSCAGYTTTDPNNGQVLICASATVQQVNTVEVTACAGDLETISTVSTIKLKVTEDSQTNDPTAVETAEPPPGTADPAPPAKTTRTAALEIVWCAYSSKGVYLYQYRVYDKTPGEAINYCKAEAIEFKSLDDADGKSKPLPTDQLDPFKSHGIQDCEYKSDADDQPGTLSCPGFKQPVQCDELVSLLEDDTASCSTGDGSVVQTPLVSCDWGEGQ